MRPILQSTHWIEWLEQGHLSFGAFLWQYLLYALHTKEWRVSLFIKNSVWLLLPAGEVHGKERSQARKGVSTRVVMREILHPLSEEGRRVPDIGDGMQELSLGLAAVAPQPGTEGKCFYPLPKACKPKGKSDVSCVPFLLHIYRELGKRGNVSVPDGKMYCELCVRSQRGWIWFKTSYSKAYFNRYKVL